MTILQPAIVPQARYFPSRIALLAAAELVLIALLLRLSNSPAFFAAAIACSLCSIQLGILLINRFQVNTRKIRRIARQAEFSQQAVIITDAEGHIKWTNPRFTRLTGFYLSEIVGKTFGLVLHGQETANRAVEEIRRHMRDEQPFDVELMVYNRAAESLWINSKGEPVADNHGSVTHYVITQTDVSDQHRLITDLASGKALTSDIGMQAARPLVMQYPPTPPAAAALARQFETLAISDDRQQLQALVEGMQSRIEQCVDALPPLKVEKAA